MHNNASIFLCAVWWKPTSVWSISQGIDNNSIDLPIHASHIAFQYCFTKVCHSFQKQGTNVVLVLNLPGHCIFYLQWHFCVCAWFSMWFFANNSLTRDGICLWKNILKCFSNGFFEPDANAPMLSIYASFILMLTPCIEHQTVNRNQVVTLATSKRPARTTCYYTHSNWWLLMIDYNV